MLVSCASNSAMDYVPKTLGTLGTPSGPGGAAGPLEVRVEYEKTEAVLGPPITMTARIKNIGAEAIWIPKDPPVVFTWMYPSGQRDNFLISIPATKNYTEEDARQLKPGEEVVKRVDIKTQYFPRAGITEFGALLIVPKNTNTALAPFAEGKFKSSRFGVNMIKR